MLTQNYLKTLLKYDPKTGVFTYVKSKHGITKNQVAGSSETRGRTQYRRIKINGCRYYAHRLAFLYMTGTIPPIVDHVNHNGTDNRWTNLRGTTHAGNSKNRAKLHSTTNGILGVYWIKARGKWLADISINNRSKYLGLFDNLLDAVAARKTAEKDLGFHPNHGK